MCSLSPVAWAVLCRSVRYRPAPWMHTRLGNLVVRTGAGNIGWGVGAALRGKTALARICHENAPLFPLRRPDAVVLWSDPIRGRCGRCAGSVSVNGSRRDRLVVPSQATTELGSRAFFFFVLRVFLFCPAAVFRVRSRLVQVMSSGVCVRFCGTFLPVLPMRPLVWLVAFGELARVCFCRWHWSRRCFRGPFRPWRGVVAGAVIVACLTSLSATMSSLAIFRHRCLRNVSFFFLSFFFFFSLWFFSLLFLFF